MGMGNSDEVRSVRVEVSPEGCVLLVCSLGAGLSPAILGFDSQQADGLGQELRKAAKEAQFIERVASHA